MTSSFIQATFLNRIAILVNTGHLLLHMALLGVAVMAASACTTVPKHLNSGKVLPTTLPFSEAIQVGPTLYLSGQIGNIPGSLKLPSGGIQPEAKQVMENIKTSLESHGCTLADVVKCTVMLADMNEWNVSNEVYKTFFSAGRFPAQVGWRSTPVSKSSALRHDDVALT